MSDYRPRYPLSLPLVLVALFGAACALPAPEPEPQPEPKPVVEESAEQVRLAEELADLRNAHQELVAAYGGLEDRATKAELLLLERDGRIAELEGRLSWQRRILDETISEVVRAKARFRSVESRAEAASQIAEAEIAIKTLADLAGGTSTAEYAQAEDFVERSTQEFEAENYGGAIYLTSRAKSLIGLAQMQLRGREDVEVSAGEVLFGVPLALRVVKSSNVRGGPGLDYEILRTLEVGTAVTAFSFKGKWVHVRLVDGSRGWIFQTLVGER